jgi:hypothetical protein
MDLEYICYLLVLYMQFVSLGSDALDHISIRAGVENRKKDKQATKVNNE